MIVSSNNKGKVKMIDSYNVIDFVYDGCKRKAKAFASFYGVEAHPMIDDGEEIGYEVKLTDAMKKDFENDESMNRTLEKIRNETGVCIDESDFEIAF